MTDPTWLAIQNLTQERDALKAEAERLRDAYQRTCVGMGYPEPIGQGDLTSPEWAHQLRQRAVVAEAKLRQVKEFLLHAREWSMERRAPISVIQYRNLTADLWGLIDHDPIDNALDAAREGEK